MAWYPTEVVVTLPKEAVVRHVPGGGCGAASVRSSDMSLDGSGGAAPDSMVDGCSPSGDIEGFSAFDMKRFVQL